MKVPKHKHELKEDKFITSVFLASEFAKKNWKNFAFAGVGIVIILIIIFGIFSSQKSQSKDAVEQFDIAFGYFLDKNFEKAEEEFTKLSENYSSTKEHKWANFYLGKICLSKDSIDYVQAENYFQKSLKIRNKILKKSAMVGLAKCYLDQGNEEEYLSLLIKAVKKFPNSFDAADLIFEIAEYFDENSEPIKAKKYYQKIVDDYESSSLFYKAKQKI